MRKTISTLILAGALCAGCSQSQTSTPLEGGTPPTEDRPQIVATAAEQRAFPDKTYFRDEGVVVSGRQIKRESLPGGSANKGVSQDYVNEKVAVNYQVAQQSETFPAGAPVDAGVVEKPAEKSPSQDFLAAIEAGADAVLAAGLFHRGEYTVGQIKEFLINNNIKIRK